MVYMIFKLPRYGRLFEIDNSINEILEYYGQSKTVFEIKNLRKRLAIIQFAVETLINLHVLTCSQIILCTHREFEMSWMGQRSVGLHDLAHQYIIALYFVTTTLSTCGFGDISASPGDSIEALVILLF